MASLNKVLLIGNVTPELELRHTPQGTAVCDVGTAINHTRRDKNDNKIEEVTFVDVTLWGRVAEIACQYSGKGKPLMVEGRLHEDTWTDTETGAKRRRLKVVGENIQLLNSGEPRPAAGTSQPAPARTAPAVPAAYEEVPEDDIPF